jgi:hypothetical protein
MYPVNYNIIFQMQLEAATAQRDYYNTLLFRNQSVDYGASDGTEVLNEALNRTGEEEYDSSDKENSY